MNNVLLIMEIKKSLHYTKVCTVKGDEVSIERTINTHRQVGLLTFLSIFETETLRVSTSEAIIRIIKREFRNSYIDSWYCLPSYFIVNILEEAGIYVYRKHYNNTILGIDTHITEEDMAIMKKRIIEAGLTVTEIITDQEKHKKTISHLKQIFGDKLPLLLKALQAFNNKNMAIVDIANEIQRQEHQLKVVNIK